MISNSDYLDPEGFNGDVLAPGLDPSDTCDLCGVGDARDNWLIFQRETKNFICEQCLDNNE